MSIDRHTRGLLERAKRQAEKAAAHIGDALAAGELGEATDFASDNLADAQTDLDEARGEA